MLDLKKWELNPNENKVFEYFYEISKIPHGSGNMKQIADYCENFAQNFGFRYIRDNADNLIIYKDGCMGLENASPIILQGHIDMVCQNDQNTVIDFEKDGLEIFVDGDFIKAKGTTLGADNGIAVAYIMAILSSTDIPHPPIEAVFTVDEEIGLLGANALDTSVLKAQKMINIDSESDDVLTVSCAGGQDVVLNLKTTTTTKTAHKLTLTIGGLLGGHSGVEIDKGRTNANVLMGKILNFLNDNCDFDLISINGGKKPNAIPDYCTAQICTTDPEMLLHWFSNAETLELFKIKETEPDFYCELSKKQNGEFTCLDNKTKNDILYLLSAQPDGVVKMSKEIEGLVETSLNLGIVATKENALCFHYAVRSNKEKELKALGEKVLDIAKKTNAESSVFGFYPPWEYKENSALRELYKKCYKEQNKTDIKVEAIHAGLECAVFSSTIKGLDCISIGPNIYDVHTPKERLDISSTVKTFNLLLKVLVESINL